MLALGSGRASGEDAEIAYRGGGYPTAEPRDTVRENDQRSLSDYVFGKKQRIRLSLNYLENAGGGQPRYPYSQDLQNALRTSTNYAEFVEHGRASDRKIEFLGDLGWSVGHRYDYSYPRRSINFEKVFQSVKNGDPSGAICGGSHKFLTATAEKMGIPAATFAGRFYEKASAHVSGILHEKDGFYGLDYGELLPTKTHDLEKALRAIQAYQGRVEFLHQIFRDGKFLKLYTEDGKAYLRFIGLDPTTRKTVNAIEGYVDGEDDGTELVAGNRELSVSRVVGSGFSGKEDTESRKTKGYWGMKLKAGIVDGVPGSGLVRSHNITGGVKVGINQQDTDYEWTYLTQLDLGYSLLKERGGGYASGQPYTGYTIFFQKRSY